jgi:hypothetical protein
MFSIKSRYPSPSADCLVPHNTVRDKIYIRIINRVTSYLAELIRIIFIRLFLYCPLNCVFNSIYLHFCVFVFYSLLD